MWSNGPQLQVQYRAATMGSGEVTRKKGPRDNQKEEAFCSANFNAISVAILTCAAVLEPF